MYTPEAGFPAQYDPFFMEPQSAPGTPRVTAAEKRFLDFIAGGEAPGGYNQRFAEPAGQNKYDLTGMTINQVIALPANRGNGLVSTASGRYQFLSKTLSEMRDALGLTGNELFTPDMQDYLAVERMRQTRDYDDYMAGRITPERFARNMADEWASLPDPATGKSRYRNQPVAHTPDELLAQVEALKTGQPVRQVSGIASGPLLRKGAQGAPVAEVQRALAEKGFNPGPADGIFGKQTSAAVRAFQASAGLKADGVVGPMTRGALAPPPTMTADAASGPMGTVRIPVAGAEDILPSFPAPPFMDAIAPASGLGYAAPDTAPPAQQPAAPEPQGAQVSPAMMAVVSRARQISPIQFGMYQTGGARTPEEQEALVRAGWSKTMKSDHLGGGAIDLIPVDDNGVPQPDNPALYRQVSDAMMKASEELGVPIEWGGNWKSFKDQPHYGLLDPNTQLPPTYEAATGRIVPQQYAMPQTLPFNEQAMAELTEAQYPGLMQPSELASRTPQPTPPAAPARSAPAPLTPEALGQTLSGLTSDALARIETARQAAAQAGQSYIDIDLDEVTAPPAPQPQPQPIAAQPLPAQPQPVQMASADVSQMPIGFSASDFGIGSPDGGLSINPQPTRQDASPFMTDVGMAVAGLPPGLMTAPQPPQPAQIASRPPPPVAPPPQPGMPQSQPGGIAAAGTPFGARQGTGGILGLLGIGKSPAQFYATNSGSSPYGDDQVTQWKSGETNALGGSSGLQWQGSKGNTVTAVQNPWGSGYFTSYG